MEPASNSPADTPQQSFFRRKGKYVLLGAGVLVLLVVGAFVIGSKNGVGNPTSSTSDNKSTEEPQDDESLARAIIPCKLLTDEERATFGLEAGEADDKNIRGCDWDRTDVLYTHVSIYPLYDLARFDGADASTESITIGSHQAHLIVPHSDSVVAGSCEAVIAIGPTQSASVVITANGKFSDTTDTTKYCDIVKQLATYIEAKLP
jgi:hypothetical protein